MKLITDLHIHSHYSLATSKQLTPEYLDFWGKMKGVQVIATGDFTHPGWTKELQEKIEPAEPGLFNLKPEYQIKNPLIRFNQDSYFTRFILSAEISSIYKKNGKVRKVHSVILAPDFETVEKIQQSLINIGGNITSDGRPILGLDAKNLLEICLEISEDIFFIPAHIWTPWFSVLGAKSGFDSMEECFEDLTPHIYAVETGLSTNAPMNWMCSFLDDYVLISNSDAHSPEKLGRNANIMDCNLSYSGIVSTMKKDKENKFLGTIDMYPQEGKYHYDGHRKCGVVYNPVETLEHDGLCAKCGRKLTVGVMNRIVQLSDRENLAERPDRLPFHSIIPLKEIISEIVGVGPSSKTVTKKYNDIIGKLGSELNILLNVPIPEISSLCGPVLSEAVDRMRQNKVIIKEGFDGEYGIIKVFREGELEEKGPTLFPSKAAEPPAAYKSQQLLNFSLARYRELQNSHRPAVSTEKEAKSELNEEQQAAVEHFGTSCLVLAGPGTGKTRTLVAKIEYLLNNKKADPENILGITFTNKAADEIRQRIEISLGKEIAVRLNIHTFHSLGLKIIKDNCSRLNIDEKFYIIDNSEQKQILKQYLEVPSPKLKKILNALSLFKQNNRGMNAETEAIFSRYQKFLKQNNLLDIDDLVYQVVKMLGENSQLSSKYRDLFHYIMVDEFQDINGSQFQLLQQLSGGNNLFAIGDSNQAIYGFRGADMKYIDSFTDHFPEARLINLKKSYRCSNNILKASSGVLGNNDLLTGLQKGVKIRINHSVTDKSEAEYVARKIEEIAGGMGFFSMDSDVTDGYDENQTADLNEIVVLCRTKAIMPPVARAFRDHRIPYEIVDNKPFYQEKPVSDVLDIYKTLYYDNCLFSVESQLADLKTINKSLPVEKTLATIIDRYFSDQQEAKQQEFKRLLGLARNFSQPGDFLQRLALGSNEDYYNITKHEVKIMTLHAAKGLEFQHVFIIGCEKGLIPFSLYDRMQSDYNEEKRLFYVGMTRSKKYLYLSYADGRSLRGRSFNLAPSPFLEKIKKELLEQEKNNYKKKEKNKDLQLDLF
jgi:uncharacterized protein (TIGR00375 family)